jgi:hypothetical protein
MVKSKLRYYTYKITFKDLPKYFYYGRHKDSGKPYFGSPRTWKHLWDQFEPEIQILQWYETWEEVSVNERKIIDATWEDIYSLNEHNGDGFSEEVLSKAGKLGGRKTFESKKGMFDPDYRASNELKEHLSRGGKIGGANGGNITGPKSFKEKTGLFDPDNIEVVRKGNVKGGSIAGKLNVKNKVGIHDPKNKHKKSEGGSLGGSNTNKQKWMCLETGHISNPGGLSRYQKANGIDKSKRVRLS